MKLKHLLLVVGIILLFGFPIVIPNPYYVHLVETILIYAILLFGLDIVVGYTGQVSLGHAGLFGIGAYVAGTLFFHLNMPFWVTAPAAILITSVFGGMLAASCLGIFVIPGLYVAFEKMRGAVPGMFRWPARKSTPR